MNYEEAIFSYLETKNWPLFTKVFFIYLKLCQDFSYDCRFLYGSDEEKKIIYNHIPNTQNITSYEIICTSWAHIAKSIIEKMGLKCSIEHDVLPHVFLVVDVESYKIKLEPMKRGYDLVRAKVGLPLYGFISLNTQEGLEQKLSESKKIIFKNNEKLMLSYMNEVLEESKRKNEYKNTNPYLDFDNSSIMDKLTTIRNLLNEENRLKNFDDYSVYYDYLIGKVMTTWERSRIHSYPFWKMQKDRLQIVRLSLMQLEKQPAILYGIVPNNERMIFQTVNRENAKFYLDSYEGKYKNLYRELYL